MKKILSLSVLLLSLATAEIKAKEVPTREKFGNTLNLGAGIG